MSFILDALRKSEHDRQRQAGPGIAELRSSTARARLPLWAIALGALLVVNLMFVVVLVMRPDASPVVSEPRASASTTLAPPTTIPPAASPTVAAVSPPPASQPSIASAAPAPAQTQRREPVPVTPTDPELRPSAPPSESSDAQALAELPTLNDVILKGLTAVPELHLDLHVYAARPADRFVFINNARYHEGAQMPGGILIERITRDGVVLNHRGVRFFLPRE